MNIYPILALRGLPNNKIYQQTRPWLDFLTVLYFLFVVEYTPFYNETEKKK